MDASQKITAAYMGNSVTDTLSTKILLGIFGCVPAYDRYFKDGAGKYEICAQRWGTQSLHSLWQYYNKYRDEFDRLRHEISNDGLLYPPMKLMDMCLWQIGYDDDPKQL
jgi:hypothetical protein